MRTVNGVHQVVVIGDDRKATKEILEQRLADLDAQIANWKPPTAWEAANQRTLKRIKSNRTAILKALAKLENKEKDHRNNPKI